MVTPAIKTTAVNFKIIITLRRAQKFGDTGPNKISIFCINNMISAKYTPICIAYYCTIGLQIFIFQQDCINLLTTILA